MEEQATQNSQESKSLTTSNKNESQRTLAPTSSGTSARVLGWASPFSLMRVFMDDLDRLVEGFGMVGSPASESSSTAIRTSPNWIPAVEVFERDGKFVIRADVPGLDREQLYVEIDDDKVVLSGERVDEQEERASSYYRRERSYGRFRRVIPLAEGVDASQATATFNNGVLEISMPAPKRADARKLEITEGDASESQSKSDGTSANAPSSGTAH
jgi:HSP20 family protein